MKHFFFAFLMLILPIILCSQNNECPEGTTPASEIPGACRNEEGMIDLGTIGPPDKAPSPSRQRENDRESHQGIGSEYSGNQRKSSSSTDRTINIESPQEKYDRERMRAENFTLAFLEEHKDLFVEKTREFIAKQGLKQILLRSGVVVGSLTATALIQIALSIEPNGGHRKEFVVERERRIREQAVRIAQQEFNRLENYVDFDKLSVVEPFLSNSERAKLNNYLRDGHYHHFQSHLNYLYEKIREGQKTQRSSHNFIHQGAPPSGNIPGAVRG